MCSLVKLFFPIPISITGIFKPFQYRLHIKSPLLNTIIIISAISRGLLRKGSIFVMLITNETFQLTNHGLSLIHISEPTRPY